jgi:peptidoglycan biosynthesis protein MviN/MurJ (putative lipid II flippase)
MLMLTLHAVLQQRQPGYYAASRGWLVLVFKLLLTAVLMSLVVTCVLEPIHTVGSYMKVLLMGSGIVMLNCTGGVQAYCTCYTCAGFAFV